MPDQDVASFRWKPRAPWRLSRWTDVLRWARRLLEWDRQEATVATLLEVILIALFGSTIVAAASAVTLRLMHQMHHGHTI